MHFILHVLSKLNYILIAFPIFNSQFRIRMLWMWFTPIRFIGTLYLVQPVHHQTDWNCTYIFPCNIIVWTVMCSFILIIRLLIFHIVYTCTSHWIYTNSRQFDTLIIVTPEPNPHICQDLEKPRVTYSFLYGTNNSK